MNEELFTQPNQAQADKPNKQIDSDTPHPTAAGNEELADSYAPVQSTDAPTLSEESTPETGETQIPLTTQSRQTRVPVMEIDGKLLKQMFESGVDWLEQHAPNINAMNVFPVPDGDTGTNMLLTMRSAIKEVANQANASAADIARKISRGAVMGARGNSGVILSQILSGFAQIGENKTHYTTEDVATAFRRASESAYNAVMKPVEGTILTVARAVADEAERAAMETNDIRLQLQRITDAAREILKRTPDMLPILKQAGVVDSGGQGLVTLLEGMVRGFGDDEGRDTFVDNTSPTQTDQPQQPSFDELPPTLEGDRYGYDIQYLIRGENLDVEAIRAHINSLGECPLVVGDSSLVKIHVHSLNPAPALEYGASLGMLDDIVVENLDLQFQEYAKTHEPAVGKTEPVPQKQAPVGVIAVAMGEGLGQSFIELGASAVIAGGQTMNPSTSDILEAIQSVNAEEIILLPNNKNILMAAQQAQKLADRPVHVIPTVSIPQGLAAQMAFDFESDSETNIERMTAAIENVVTGEVTTAVRTTTIDGIDVTDGDIIGLLEGKLVAAGDSIETVIMAILDQLDLHRFEIVTLYAGENVSDSTAEALVAKLEDAMPELEFELHRGDQPHYHFLIGIE